MMKEEASGYIMRAMYAIHMRLLNKRKDFSYTHGYVYYFRHTINNTSDQIDEATMKTARIIEPGLDCEPYM